MANFSGEGADCSRGGLGEDGRDMEARVKVISRGGVPLGVGWVTHRPMLPHMI